MKINRDALLEQLEIDTYLLSFDLDGDNYCFVNFNSLSKIKEFIEEKGLLNLYNEWLDFINSDHIAGEIEGYLIGKVIAIEEDKYSVEVIERY